MEQTGYVLNIIVVPGNNLEIIFNYNANVFDDLATIQNVGHYKTILDTDGWTAKTIDGSLSAQYEHTIAITKNGPVIITE